MKVTLQCQFTTPWLQNFHQQTVNTPTPTPTIPAELSGVLSPKVPQPEALSMSQAEGMTALLTYLMEKDEREKKEGERENVWNLKKGRERWPDIRG